MDLAPNTPFEIRGAHRLQVALFKIISSASRIQHGIDKPIKTPKSWMKDLRPKSV